MKETLFNINEVFCSIQGEGMHTGFPCIFVRFADCNMSCYFCDTNFDTNFVMNAKDLIDFIKRISKENYHVKFVVFTGGEPLLQPVELLAKELRARGFMIGLETNGTKKVDIGLFDSLSLSPKVPINKCKVRYCHSLKILHPYMEDIEPKYFDNCDDFYAHSKYIQPIFSLKYDDDWNIKAGHEAAKEVHKLQNGWKLGVQLHILLDLK